VLTAEAGGLVTADAQAAFQRASAITPEDPRSRLFLALARLQDGDALGARDAFSALAQSLPADSPWRSAALDAVKEAEARMAAATNPGPSDADVDAAAGMSDTDRAAMIETMVASLDEKLRANPADPEGWARLVRSYVVLGKPEAAKEALGRGLAALGDGSAEAIGLEEFAAGLGLKAVEE
jgi:cytochrome c-type biogenesis protein CcmH